MAETQTIDVFEQMKERLTGQKEKFEDMKKKAAKLEEDDQTEILRQYRSKVEDLVSGKEGTSVKDLTVMDQGLVLAQESKLDLSQISEGLTLQFDELGQFYGSFLQYQGLEKAVAYVSTKLATRMQRKRAEKADIEESLRTIVSYGQHMLGVYDKKILACIESHECIKNLIQRTSKELSETEPLYQIARQQKEELERQNKTLQDEMDKADATAYATLNNTKVELDEEYQRAKINETLLLTRAKNDRESLDTQRKYLNGFNDIIEGISAMRTGLESKLKNHTEAFENLVVGIQTAYSVKAGAEYDKAMNKTINIGGEVMVAMANAVKDTAAGRIEKRQVETTVLNRWIELENQRTVLWNQRMNKIKAEYQTTKDNS